MKFCSPNQTQNETTKLRFNGPAASNSHLSVTWERRWHQPYVLAEYSKCFHDDLCPTTFPLRKTNFCTRGKREQGLCTWTPIPLLTPLHRWYLHDERMPAEGCGLFLEPPLSQLENPSAAICKPNGVQWMDQEQRDKTCILRVNISRNPQAPRWSSSTSPRALTRGETENFLEGGIYYTGVNSNELMWTHGLVGLHIDEIMESCLVRPLKSFSRQTRDHFQLVLTCYRNLTNSYLAD